MKFITIISQSSGLNTIFFILFQLNYISMIVYYKRIKLIYVTRNNNIIKILFYFFKKYLRKKIIAFQSPNCINIFLHLK